MLPVARALAISDDQLDPWLTYLLFLCLQQGSQLLGKFLTCFQKVATNVTLSKLAKVAALKVVLDLTGADLLPCSDHTITLNDLIEQLQAYALGSSEAISFLHLSSRVNSGLSPNLITPTTVPSSSPKSDLTRNFSAIVTTDKNKVTKYELKCVGPPSPIKAQLLISVSWILPSLTSMNSECPP
ncbi:hypothetical protein DSO57_1005688 [Entomophthora muscae]|uniref:Uncharacterized protein n=1 Tax=Entomophthora muscae TaxID=34485 RepID=A0ACC2TWF5_9FUNG|nr:hypothetical protein DSO57_1005688 [Entomophthora muscae]